MTIRRFLLVTAACAPAVIAIIAGCTRRSTEGAFVIMRADDTLAVEYYRKRQNSFESELVSRPDLLRSTLQGSLGPGSLVRELSLQVHRLGVPDSLPDVGRARLSVLNDSITTEVQTPDGSRAARRFPLRADFAPYYDLSFILIELAVKRAHGLHYTQLSMYDVATPNSPPVPATVSRKRDSVVVHTPQLEIRLAIDVHGNLLGGTIPSHNLRIAKVAGSFASRVGTSKASYSQPLGAPYSGVEVRIPATGGHVLAGTFTYPDNRRSKVGAVVLVSGGGIQDRNSASPAFPDAFRAFQEIADTLGRRGIAVLRLDDPGTGSSTGDPANTTAADFAKDIQAAVGFLRAQPRVDSNRIALLGHSEGGNVASMVAAADPRIRALVLLAAPARPGKQIMIEQTEWLAAHDTSLSQVQRDSVLKAARIEYDVDSVGEQLRRAAQRQLSATLGEDLDSLVTADIVKTDFAALVMPASLRYFLRYDPLPMAQRIRAPVLLLQGTTDRQVRPEHAAELASAVRRGGNRDVTVHLFGGLNHLFVADSTGDPRNYFRLTSKRVTPVVLGTIADWLTAHLGGN
jgi:uncharacterized protein